MPIHSVEVIIISNHFSNYLCILRVKNNIKKVKLLITAIGVDACLDRPENYCEDDMSNATFSVDIECYISTQCKCLRLQNEIMQLYSIVPYLYPFSIEFNILVGKFLYKKVESFHWLSLEKETYFHFEKEKNTFILKMHSEIFFFTP